MKLLVRIFLPSTNAFCELDTNLLATHFGHNFGLHMLIPFKLFRHPWSCRFGLSLDCYQNDYIFQAFASVLVPLTAKQFVSWFTSSLKLRIMFSNDFSFLWLSADIPHFSMMIQIIISYECSSNTADFMSCKNTL